MQQELSEGAPSYEVRSLHWMMHWRPGLRGALPSVVGEALHDPERRGGESTRHPTFIASLLYIHIYIIKYKPMSRFEP